MSNWIGDFDTGSRVDFEFCTVDSTGLPTALTSGSCCVRKVTAGTPAAGSLAPLGVAAITTSGGLNHLTVFTGSDSVFFAAGADYHAFIGYGTVSGVSVVGYALGHFSIRNRRDFATAVWDQTTTSHVTAGTFGGMLDAVPATSEIATSSDIATAVWTYTAAQPGQGTPSATATMDERLGYLYKAWRNRTTQTASQYSLYNDDATTVDQKATFSDNGTVADKGEVATGP